MTIKLGTPVRQIVPAPVAGIVVKKQFDEAADAFQFLVEWLSPEERTANAPLEAALAQPLADLQAATESGDENAIAAAKAVVDALPKPVAPHQRWFNEGELEAQTEGETA